MFVMYVSCRHGRKMGPEAAGSNRGGRAGGPGLPGAGSQRVVAVSAEDRDTTARLKDEMQLIRLPLGHSVDAEAVAQEWGLFLTRNSTEPDAPALHFEPAQSWVKADGTLGGASVQSLPNFWPDVTQTLRGIENTLKKFPERGAG